MIVYLHQANSATARQTQSISQVWKLTKTIESEFPKVWSISFNRKVHMCFMLRTCEAYLSSLYELTHLILIILLEVANFSDRITVTYYSFHFPDDKTDS